MVLAKLVFEPNSIELQSLTAICPYMLELYTICILQVISASNVGLVAAASHWKPSVYLAVFSLVLVAYHLSD